MAAGRASWFVALIAAIAFRWIVNLPGRRIGDTGQETIQQRVNVLWDESEKEESVQRFVRALKVPAIAKVSAANHVDDAESFHELLRVLENDFTAVFDTLEVEVVEEHSLMLRWPGANESLDPLLLISHLDVVPALGNWTYPPFAATIADGQIWARGALDTKFTAVAILEALRALIEDNVELPRTVIVALGHDEEVGGFGARAMASLLKERGVRPFVVLDEGGMIAMERYSSWFVGDVVPFALVGVAEKTAMNFEITVPGVGGHGSLPPPTGTSAASRLAGLIHRVEQETLPASLCDAMVAFMRAVGEQVPFGPLRWVLQHADAAQVRPVLGKLLGSPFLGAKLNALSRTTVGIVEVSAGDGAQNVLPREGKIGVNVRSLPGVSRDEVARFLAHLAGSDAKVEDVSAVNYPEQTTTSPDSEAFRVVQEVIQRTLSHRASTGRHEMRNGEVAPIPVVPFLLTGMTDSRWYHEIAPSRIVRFSPFSLSFEELSLIHGTDERVGVAEYLDAVRFYHELIKSVQPT